jgi:hypothetical protein
MKKRSRLSLYQAYLSRLKRFRESQSFTSDHQTISVVCAENQSPYRSLETQACALSSTEKIETTIMHHLGVGVLTVGDFSTSQEPLENDDPSKGPVLLPPSDVNVPDWFVVFALRNFGGSISFSQFELNDLIEASKNVKVEFIEYRDPQRFSLRIVE